MKFCIDQILFSPTYVFISNLCYSDSFGCFVYFSLILYCCLLISGTVNPQSNLECEVVFYPSYYAPLSGLFQLRIDGGNNLELQTRAEVKFIF